MPKMDKQIRMTDERLAEIEATLISFKNESCYGCDRAATEGLEVVEALRELKKDVEAVHDDLRAAYNGLPVRPGVVWTAIRLLGEAIDPSRKIVAEKQEGG